jgi:hypothetical protein
MRRRHRAGEEDSLSDSLFNQFLIALSEAEHIYIESKREQIERLLALSKETSFARLDETGNYESK